MERLLTPLLNRFLRKFVKSSQEGEYGMFKASLSGGGVQLHNLELDLDPILPAGILASQRAFARSLQVKVPWTALNTQSIEVNYCAERVLLLRLLREKRYRDQKATPATRLLRHHPTHSRKFYSCRWCWTP